jgi:hypothetical protein
MLKAAAVLIVDVVEKVCVRVDIPGVFDDMYLTVLGCFRRNSLRRFTMNEEVCLFVLTK